MAMDGYYDHHALLVLERHLVLAGPVTDDTRRIGHSLASILGLSFIDLDRRIEHDAGASIWDLARNEGTASLRRRETLALREATRDRPYGVLVLGDGALIARQNQIHVTHDARLIVLDYRPENVYWRLRTLADERNGRWHPLETEPLDDISQVHAYIETRATGFDCDERIEVSGRRFKGIVRDLEAKLVS